MTGAGVQRITVMGLGRIGSMIATMLDQDPHYQVTGIDIDPQRVAHFSRQFATKLLVPEHATKVDYQALLTNQDAVISALTFNDNPDIAKAALAIGCSYFDLTEDVHCTALIKDIADSAGPGQIFMPQCGLAPGFIGILGNSFCHLFDTLDTLKLRVGALPEYPANQMMYNLTWNTEGLINEYANPCQAIKNGELTLVEPLEGLEQFAIAGIEYEAFNTSGGLANLCYSMAGKVRDLSYKTIRYPGHCQLMRFLFNDLRLGEVGRRRNMLMEIFDNTVATTVQDQVVISVVASGYNQGQLQQHCRTFLLRHTASASAIQLATASAVLVALDITLQNKHGRQGFVEQESLTVEDFLNNQFATVYRDGELIAAKGNSYSGDK